VQLNTGPRFLKLCSKINTFIDATFKFTKQGDRVLLGDLHSILGKGGCKVKQPARCFLMSRKLQISQFTYAFTMWCRATRLLLFHLITLNDTHTHTRTLRRTPLHEGSARRRHLYLITHNTHERYPCPRRDSNPQSQRASGRTHPRPHGHRDRLKLVP
jgi:hypothetical protein